MIAGWIKPETLKLAFALLR